MVQILSKEVDGRIKVDIDLTEEEAVQAGILRKAFCATGRGGGVDPTCGSGKGKGVGIESFDEDVLAKVFGVLKREDPLDENHAGIQSEIYKGLGNVESFAAMRSIGKSSGISFEEVKAAIFPTVFAPFNDTFAGTAIPASIERALGVPRSLFDLQREKDRKEDAKGISKRDVNTDLRVNGFTKYARVVSEKNVDKLVKATYEKTQEILRDAGITELKLYRGMGKERQDAQGNAIESWTGDKNLAEKFAEAYQGSVVDEKSIPVSRIFATPAVGWGVGSQVEVLVLGSEPTPPENKQASNRNNYHQEQFRWEKWLKRDVESSVLNAKSTKTFCPTGPGGGVNPTCSPGKTQSVSPQLHPATRGEDKVWRLANGDAAPEHIQKLGIPPAWKNVVVSLDPNANLLARGEDAKGRTQPKYSANHTMRAAADKFGRVSELRQKRKQIFDEIENDIQSGNKVEEALCTKLIMKTGMRPGSDSDSGADYKSYGATTLEGRHIIQKEDGSVVARFVPGKKKGQEIEMPITDKRLGSQLLKRAQKAGPEGRIFKTDAGSVRSYSKTKDGGGFKTKDHRTALGTETAIAAMKSINIPRTKKEYKQAVKDVSTKVSDVLGNTPSIAFSSYIDPQIWQHWKSKAGM